MRHRHKYRVLKRRRAFGGDASKSQVVLEPRALRRSDALKGVGEGKSTQNDRSKTLRRNRGSPHQRRNLLTSRSAGTLWSEVEWSPSRQRWCIQDAAGQCLTHVEHIVGQDRDVQTAIRLAKRMIVNGRMPTPEDAEQQLKEQERRDRLGEPWQPLQDKIKVERD